MRILRRLSFAALVACNSGSAGDGSSSSPRSTASTAVLPDVSTSTTAPPSADTAAVQIYASRDHGQTWKPSDTGIPDTATVVDFALAGDVVFAAADADGIFISRDRGETWSKTPAPAPNVAIIALAHTPTTLLAGTRRNGVFASQNDGKTWAPSSEGLPNAEIRRLVTMDRRVFAATNGGLFVSEAGASWRHLTGTGQVNNVVAAGKELFLADIPGVMRSRDQGVTWVRVYEGTTPHNLAADGDEVFAMLYGAGIVRTRDGGRTWDSAQEGLPTNLAEYTFQLLRVDGARYAARWHGVYISDPAGAPWRPSSEGVPISQAITDLVHVGDTILAAAVPSLPGR